MNNKIKKVLCKNWLDNKCKFTKKECNFAHGEGDIVKIKCLSGLNCWVENCIYQHPQEWNSYDNKKECIFCPKGFCDKSNNKYKHIIDNVIKEVDKNVILEISKINNFPSIVKNKNINNLEYKYSDVLNIKNNNSDYSYKKIDVKTKKENNKLINIKKQLQNKYIVLSKIDKEDWSNSIDIETIEKEIDIINLEYEKLKIIKMENNVFDDDNLNLDVIFNNNDNKKEYHENDLCNYTNIPNISLTINGINYDDYNNDKNKIENMEKDFEIHVKKIKQNINNNIKNSYYKFILLNNLNEIKMMIDLFKRNYEDIIKY